MATAPTKVLAAGLTALSSLPMATWAQKANTFEIVGDGKVSAQMLFLGTANTLYIVDKTEDNPFNVTSADGTTHPAWASEYDLRTNEARTMDIVTNSFCAGGIPLGDGRWINAGGNQVVGSGGATVDGVDVTNVYDSADGGTALRILTPCEDESCDWIDDEDNYMNSRRWYPQVETLPDGSAIIIGGDQWGGFVNDPGQNNPTYEFFPSRGEDVDFDFLVNDTMPANLYPLTYLLPNGLIFLQAGWKTTLLDYETNTETRMPDIPDAVKTYPASGANAMLTQNKANNWTAPIIFCGGSDIKDNEWGDHQDNVDWFINQHENAASCVQINPENPDAQWERLEDDDLPEPRSMGQFIALPDGRYFLVNGIEKGVAGYDASGIPYGDDPIYSPAYFNPEAEAGSRWSRDGVQDASLPRLYHSSAVLLPDGAVATAGSNPYADFQTNGSMINAGDNSSDTEARWWSETRLEFFYPDYYDAERPSSFEMDSISYGGDAMEVDLSEDEVSDVSSAEDVKAVLIRPGFSTHAMQMGQRRVELETTLIKQDNGGAKMHIAPLPANPNVLAPGPCLFFKVINGVPSHGVMVMIGNGEIGEQPMGDYPTLPESSGFDGKSQGNVNDSNDATESEDGNSGSDRLSITASTLVAGAAAATAAFFA